MDTPRRVDVARRMMEWNGSPAMSGSRTCHTAKDALHMSLSWAPGQTPGDAEKIEACRAFLNALGMGNAQAQFWDHNDRTHSHVHVVASRVDPATGHAYDDYQRMYKGMRRAIVWEREKNQITARRQWCHDLANAVERGDDNELKRLLIKNEATITKRRLDLALAFGGKLGQQLEAKREQFVRDQDLLSLKKYAAGRAAAYTTEEIWKEEARILGMAKDVHEQNRGFEIPEYILKFVSKKYTLDQEQDVALRHLTRNNGIAVANGEAGTGKSHLLKAAREAYEMAGKETSGGAFTNEVAKDMRADGHNADTLAMTLIKLRKNEQDPWHQDRVFFVEEAGQVKTPEDLPKLMHYAKKHGTKLIFTGDRRQHGSVEHGGMFPVIQNRFGSATLTKVKRTPHKDQQRAFNHMHKRRFKPAVDIFKNSDSIDWHDNKEHAIAALAKEYTDDFLKDPDKRRMIVTATNEDRAQLNQYVSNLYRQYGKITGGMDFDTQFGPRQFGVGERIVMRETRSKEDKRKGLINGAIGHVQSIHEDPDGRRGMTIKLERGKGQQDRVFKFNVGFDKDNGEISGIDKGYAMTSYKAQGKTVDKSYIVHDPRATAPGNYVSLSRHSDKTRLYVAREDTPSHAHLVEQLRHGSDKTAAHSYMLDEASRAKIAQRRTQSPPLAPQQGHQKAAQPAIQAAISQQQPPPEPVKQITDDSFMAHQLMAKEMAKTQQAGQAERGDLQDKTPATKPGFQLLGSFMDHLRAAIARDDASRPPPAQEIIQNRDMGRGR